MLKLAIWSQTWVKTQTYVKRSSSTYDVSICIVRYTRYKRLCIAFEHSINYDVIPKCTFIKVEEITDRKIQAEKYFQIHVRWTGIR